MVIIIHTVMRTCTLFSTYSVDPAIIIWMVLNELNVLPRAPSIPQMLYFESHHHHHFRLLAMIFGEFKGRVQRLNCVYNFIFNI